MKRYRYTKIVEDGQLEVVTVSEKDILEDPKNTALIMKILQGKTVSLIGFLHTVWLCIFQRTMNERRRDRKVCYSRSIR